MFELFIIVKIIYVLIQSQNKTDTNVSILLAGIAILSPQDYNFCHGLIVNRREYFSKVWPSCMDLNIVLTNVHFFFVCWSLWI